MNKVFNAIGTKLMWWTSGFLWASKVCDKKSG